MHAEIERGHAMTVTGNELPIHAELRTAVDRAVPTLLSLSDVAASGAPARGRWSPKQVIGHLIDSASNNHQRFVRAQFTDDLLFPGYEQDAWVDVQRYQDAEWTELVAFWRSYNLHLARVIESIPARVQGEPRIRHNLHVRAFTPVPESEPATLGYFMRDYVVHLRHHLRQIPINAAG